MNIEKKLRELFLPVFGLESIDEINPEASLINDLGADSLDFVEILHLIERHFGVVIKTDEVMFGGANINTNDLFVNGRLTVEGASLLWSNFPEKKDSFKTGMTKIELFSLLTVRDLVKIIKSKMRQGGLDA